MKLFNLFNDQDSDPIQEDLRKWFKEKWVRFNPAGKIMGPCARGDDSEGKPKCLPQSKAHALGKKGRASAAARKRREDPDPERSGKAINVATKKKTSEGMAEGKLNEFDPTGFNGGGDNGGDWGNDRDRLFSRIEHALEHHYKNRLQKFHFQGSEHENRQLYRITPSHKPDLVFVCAVEIKPGWEGAPRGPNFPIIEYKVFYWNKNENRMSQPGIKNFDYFDKPDATVNHILQNCFEVERKINQFGETKNKGVAEGKHFDQCFDEACKLYDKAENKNLQPTLVQVADFQGDGSDADPRWTKLPQHVWQHYVVIVGDQVFDPTARQFGSNMPTRYHVSDLDRLWGKQYQIRPREGVAEDQGEQMSKTKALNALRKQLMDEYPYMKCGNLEEFKQRLQWLSEGMLKNHLTSEKNYKINQEEIDLYQAYRKKREQIQQGSQGVAEGRLREFAGDPGDYDRDDDDDDQYQQWVVRWANRLRDHVIKTSRSIEDVRVGFSPTTVTWQVTAKNKNFDQHYEYRFVWDEVSKRPQLHDSHQTNAPFPQDRFEPIDLGESQQGVAEGSLNEFVPPSNDGGGDDERGRRLKKLLEFAINAAKEQNVGELELVHAMNVISGDDFFQTAIDGILPDITDKEYTWIIQTAYKTVKQGVAEGLDDFHKKLQNQIKTGMAKKQSDIAILKAKNPDAWLWGPGDQVYSKKTGKTYNILDITLDRNNRPMYWYQRGQEGSGDWERGQFIANLAHKSLIKINENALTEEKCPHCQGPMFEASLMNEKKDACYYKVKSRYKVWPSAYASGALVKCRKKGAKNWGSKNEATELSELSSDTKKRYRDRAQADISDLEKHLRSEKPEYAGISKRMLDRRLRGVELSKKETANETIDDKSIQYVLYLNGAVASRYNQRAELMNDLNRLLKSNPNIKYDVKREVCTSEPIELKKVRDNLVGESRLYYNTVGSTDRQLKNDFKLKKDSQGWYLSENAAPHDKLEALRAFGAPSLVEYDLSAVSGSVPALGPDNVVSPVGSVPKTQRKKVKKNG